MSNVKEAYDALIQAIRDEYKVEPKININIHSSSQGVDWDLTRTRNVALRIQDDFGIEFSYHEGRYEDGMLLQWFDVGAFSVFNRPEEQKTAILA